MKDFNQKNVTQTRPRPKPEKKMPAIPLGSIIKSLLTIAALSLVVYALTILPSYFFQPIKPHNISITGHHVLSSETILAYLPLYKTTRWIDLDPFELSRHLSAHPWVEQANVHRRADLGIDIHVVEVTPVTYFRTKNKLYLLSRDRRLLSPKNSGKGRNLPVIVDNNVSSVSPGMRLSQSKLAKAFELISLLHSHPTLPIRAVSEIDISDPLNIQLVVMPDAVRVKLGSADFEEKLLNLKDALPQLKKEGTNIRYIDLRYKRAVVFRRKV